MLPSNTWARDGGALESLILSVRYHFKISCIQFMKLGWTQFKNFKTTNQSLWMIHNLAMRFVVIIVALWIQEDWTHYLNSAIIWWRSYPNDNRICSWELPLISILAPAGDLSNLIPQSQHWFLVPYCITSSFGFFFFHCCNAVIS